MAFNYNNAFLIHHGSAMGLRADGTLGNNLLHTNSRFAIARTPSVIDLSQALEASFMLEVGITGGATSVLHLVLLDMGAVGTGTLGLWGETRLGDSLGWTNFSPKTAPIAPTGTVADLDADDYLGINIHITGAHSAKGLSTMLAGVYGSPGAIA